MKSPASRFLIRWFVSSLGLWIAAGFLRSSINYGDSVWAIVIAGLVLALINMVIKPVLVIFSLPAIVITLGLFMVVINGLTVYLASILYSPLEISSFWAAIVAGMIIGLVNYLVTAILEDVS
ncbi:phage holin family protein [Candidatus Saccharibacteria bacterium]|nr:phage holin family protein [Candidatus Saccharibacteria bacterium]